MALHIQEIEIFAEVEESRRDKIEALFETRSFDRGDEVTTFGEPVDGLYLLDNGEVEVSIPGYKGVLATLQEGASFGELSLFRPDDVASATVTVSSENADLLFCARDSLNLALELDDQLAAGFYRGSTLLVSDRLKKTNDKIGGEISKSIKMATDLIAEISTAGDLGQTQEEFAHAGSMIVNNMTNIVKSLLVMKEAGRSVSPMEIARVADQAREIYYSDFSVFEHVNKRLKTMGQHLDNVNRILSNQDLIEVEEDLTLDEF